MYFHQQQLQFHARPEKSDPLFAAKLQEVIGGQFGEMTVMMQYLWQGWNCRIPGKYKDMILDIGTEEIGHVEMLATMCARLLEGAPSEVTDKAVATNPALAAVVGGMNVQQAIVTGGGAMPTNSQGVPWNAGYIVASGNLLTDFRSNVSAEAQSRLQTSRIMNMTDDPGVKDMLRFNLARDTYHLQQWLLGIEQLAEDGLSDVIEHSNDEHEDFNHTLYTQPGSTGGEGRWAQGVALIGTAELTSEPLQPLREDDGLLPPPDPKLFATYDGSLGAGKPGDAAGARMQGVKNVAEKVKDTLTGDGS